MCKCKTIYDLLKSVDKLVYAKFAFCTKDDELYVIKIYNNDDVDKFLVAIMNLYYNLRDDIAHTTLTIKYNNDIKYQYTNINVSQIINLKNLKKLMFNFRLSKNQDIIVMVNHHNGYISREMKTYKEYENLYK